MAIKVRCSNCSTGFTAKDALAGKRLPCPKCKDPIKIPPAPAKQPAPVAAVPAHNPLLDLLDEAGIDALPGGPMCDNCGSSVNPGAVICVKCGFNMQTGKRLETDVFGADDDDDGIGDVTGMTDAERIMARAEKQIDDMPVSAEGQDFGDGADGLVVAGVAFVMLTVLVGIGLAVIFLMDQIAEVISSAKISFFAACGLYVFCVIWISVVAFMNSAIQGIVCVATAGLYCPFFGFMQGKALMLPTIIMLTAVLIGLVSYIFAFPKEEKGFGVLLEPLFMLL